MTMAAMKGVRLRLLRRRPEAEDFWNNESDSPQHLAEDRCENLFARLSPRVAQILHRQAWEEGIMMIHTNNNNSNNVDDGRLDSHYNPSNNASDIHASGWRVTEAPSDDSCDSGISFLPLKIEFPHGETVYASYNGGNVEADLSNNRNYNINIAYNESMEG
jgi:hypothetical protein